MKAVQLSRFGGSDVLEPVDLPTPEPGSYEVLVRVHAAGVNFADTLMRQDLYAVTPPLPAVLGNEVAGVIERVGANVVGLAPGDRVAAALFAGEPGLGGYADHVVIAADLIVRLPDALAFEDAAAIMVQGLTALHLVRRSDPAGKIVLVSAAAGGVGSILVQLLKRAGAKTVVAAASNPDKLVFARALGADIGVDYSQADWPGTLTGLLGGAGPDIIYESVGGDVTPACLALLAPLGHLVIYGALNIQAFALGVPELLGMIFRNQSLSGFAFATLLDPQNLHQDLATLFEMVVRGDVTVSIGGRFALADAAEAHRQLESRRTTGKVILQVSTAGA